MSSTKMSQKEAVFAAFTNVMGTQEGKYVPSKSQRASVIDVLCAGFKAETVELGTAYTTDSELREYTSSLISNWLRKDTRLNGGVKYAAKNPGSRAGQADPELKALRALMTQAHITDEDKTEIQGYIDARVAAISTVKSAKVVDFASLPAELATKFAK